MAEIELGITNALGTTGGRMRDSSHPKLLVSLTACAIAGTASAAVFLCLLDFPMTPVAMPPVSPGAIVLNANASQDPSNLQNRPVLATPRVAASGTVFPADDAVARNTPMIEAATRLTGIGLTNEPVTQTKAEHRAEVHNQQLRKHGRVAIREHHWRRRFAHTFSSAPRLSLW
jgi:hypothetical protein